ncbi:Ser/Thr protein phosphatase protein [Irpex rosettiformis]|uniref:Ser/Thr protein phosphatase protein n=1 Tax=Irpex rosettiformis TaxID=378272 RepID=A0ACB8UAG9_9APHY|nr:Ser/Thr protein phosphatase protein [Irpex rosettiformis]
MTVNIQVLSDLHLEYSQPPGTPETPGEAYAYDIPVCAGYLALLGDTGCTCDDRLFNWLDIQLTKFRIVFYLSGNHEPHGSSLIDSHSRLATYEANHNSSIHGSQETEPYHGRFVFLNRTRYDINPTLSILGCTLWGAIDPTHPDIHALNDFKRIHNFTPETFRAEHEADVAWLNSVVATMAQEEPERRVIVFTHHAPTIKGTSDPKNQGKSTSTAFATELMAEPVCTAGTVKVWAFGHTHWCCDFVRRGIRVFSNQKGRGDGVEGFDRCKVLSL